MKYEQIATDKLIPYVNNARKHSEQQVAQIAASIREFGFLNPILVDKNNGVIAGHGRLLGAQKLGLAEVPCVRVEHLTPAQKRAYVIADNRIAETSTWDTELLNLELGDLKLEGFDLELTGFELPELDKMFGNEGTEGLTDADDVPELKPDPKSKLGDVWLLGEHRVMCGDSTDAASVAILMNGQKADMVFTDPPYGVNYDGGHATEKRREKLQNDDDVDMYDRPVKNAFQFSKENAAMYLWFADRFSINVVNGLKNAGFEIRCWIIWNKNVAQFGAIGAQYKSKHEPCIYAFKKGNAPNWCGPTNEVTVWEVPRDHKNTFHPTQKPTILAERAIKNHEAKTVLDLFLGSGSTLIACEKTGRKCYGMELSPRYVDVILKRYIDFVGTSSKVFLSTNDGELIPYEKVLEMRS